MTIVIRNSRQKKAASSAKSRTRIAAAIAKLSSDKSPRKCTKAWSNPKRHWLFVFLQVKNGELPITAEVSSLIN